MSVPPYFLYVVKIIVILGNNFSYLCVYTCMYVCVKNMSALSYLLPSCVNKLAIYVFIHICLPVHQYCALLLKNKTDLRDVQRNSDHTL